MKQKLLIVVNVDWFFFSHRLPIALGALDDGYEVHLATTFTDSKYRTLLASYGLILHDLVFDRGASSILCLFRSFYKLCRLYFLISPDLVHLVTIQPVLLGGIAARFSGVKRIVFAISGLGHTFVANSFVSSIRLFFVRSLYVLALSLKNKVVIFQNKDDMLSLKKLCSLADNQLYLLPGSGVDLSLFKPQPIPDQPFVVLMASRLLGTKGVREYIDAARLLKGWGFNARFLLVGKQDASNPASISNNELSSWIDDEIVEVLGQQSDLPNLMAHSHIICLPSYREGLPKVLCEAAACGRAVVTTDVPGCRDAIEDGVTGLLVPPQDAFALAQAIQHLFLNPVLIQDMGDAGRKRADFLFDVSDIVDNHLLLYSKLLST